MEKTKNISRFRQLVEKIGKEKVDSIAKKVLAMDLSGPTIEEYFAIVENSNKCRFINNYTGKSASTDEVLEINSINNHFHCSYKSESKVYFANKVEWIEEFEESDAILI